MLFPVHQFPVVFRARHHIGLVLVPGNDGVDHLPLIKIIEKQQKFSIVNLEGFRIGGHPLHLFGHASGLFTGGGL